MYALPPIFKREENKNYFLGNQIFVDNLNFYVHNSLSLLLTDTTLCLEARVYFLFFDL